MIMNLIEELQSEMNRVREIITEYEAIPGGQFAASFMRRDVDAAENAIATGDTIWMMRALVALREYTL